MVRTHTKIICLHPELRVLIHDTLTTKDKYFREVKGEWKKHYVLLRDTIGELQSEGYHTHQCQTIMAALFVLGMLTWMTYWFDYSRKDDIDHIADQAVEIGTQRPRICQADFRKMIRGNCLSADTPSFVVRMPR